MDLDKVLRQIDGSAEDIIEKASKMISIPSIGPANGGDGESKVAEEIMTWLKGFDSVERVDIQDGDVVRSNIIAKKNGKKDGTVWLVAHMDTVHPGDISEWKHPPFEPFVDNGRIYGLGAEDNGQGILSALYATKFIVNEKLEGHSIGIAFVADEETQSQYGIIHLLEKGYFKKNDFVIVPDWGSPQGMMIDVSEKQILWVKVSVTGKQTHGSTPNKGLNAYRIGAALLTDIVEQLYQKYDKKNELFRPSYSTFEPTKRSETVNNINVIPSRDEFWMDCRILPEYDVDEIFDFMKNIVNIYKEKYKTDITVEIVQRTASGPPSSTGTPEYDTLRQCIHEITGKEVREAGIGGGTCANFFRLEGINAYAWSSEGGTLHQPNEYLLIDNVITDAKVFASVFERLCINSL